MWFTDQDGVTIDGLACCSPSIGLLFHLPYYLAGQPLAIGRDNHPPGLSPTVFPNTNVADNIIRRVTWRTYRKRLLPGHAGYGLNLIRCDHGAAWQLFCEGHATVLQVLNSPAGQPDAAVTGPGPARQHATMLASRMPAGHGA